MFDLYFKLSSLEFIFRLFEFRLISSFDARSEPVIDISLVEFIFICLAFILDLFELVCFKELSCLVVARSALTPTLNPYVPELAAAADAICQLFLFILLWHCKEAKIQKLKKSGLKRYHLFLFPFFVYILF